MTIRPIDATALAAQLAPLVTAADAAIAAIANAVAAAPTYTPPPVTPPPVTPPASGIPARFGKTNVFWDDFDAATLDTANWTNGKTSSFPSNGPTNVGDTKLDYLDPAAVKLVNGQVVFTASPSGKLSNGKTAWHTGLITTEYSPNGFQVKAGDYSEVTVTLSSAKGAWPAFWSWRNGDNEIDTFEYHPDNASLLELSNHVGKGASSYYTNANVIKPGAVLQIGTMYGATSVDWYVNGVKVFSDGVGVGSAWSAFLILNLSVEDGTYHPAPTGTTPFSFSADNVGVWR